METLVLTLLQLILSLLPQIGVSSGAVNQILAALIQIVPMVINLSQPIINSVKNVISALQSSGALTDDQLATLESLSAEIDASWQDAVTAYLASKKPAAAPKATASSVPAGSTPVSSAGSAGGTSTAPLAP